MNCLALLGFDQHENPLRDIGWLTLREYNLRIEAWQVSQAYDRDRIAQQAWQNLRVQETTGSGKNVKSKWSNYTHFHDLESELDSIITTRNAGKSKRDEVLERVKRMNEFAALKKAGKIIPWSQRKKEAN